MSRVWIFLVLTLCLVLNSACAARRTVLGPVRDLSVEANQAGMKEFSLGNLGAAQVEFERALHLNRSIDHREGALINLNNLGTIRLKQADPDGALGIFQEALELARAVSDRAAEAELQVHTGDAYGMKEEYEKARSAYQSAENISLEIRDTLLRKRALGRLGALGITLQAWEDAEKDLRDAYRLDQEAGDEPGMALRESDLGVLAMNRDRSEEALALLTSALERHRKLEIPSGVSLDLQRLARFYLSRGQSSMAEEYAGRAFFSHTGSGDPAGAVQDLLILARACHVQGDDQRAMEIIDRAKEMLKELADSKDLYKNIEAAEAELGLNP
ncbi:MAG: tetratricopeptide repeat protein [bacterium]